MAPDRIRIPTVARWAAALLALLAVVLVAVPWATAPEGTGRALDAAGESSAASELRFDRAPQADLVGEIPADADWITVRVVDAEGSAVPDLEVIRGTHMSGARMIEIQKE